MSDDPAVKNEAAAAGHKESDPRLAFIYQEAIRALNHQQSLELAFVVTEMLSRD